MKVYIVEILLECQKAIFQFHLSGVLRYWFFVPTFKSDNQGTNKIDILIGIYATKCMSPRFI